MPLEDGVEQEVVDRYFDSAARYWRDVYERQDLHGRIYRQRMATALRWVQEAGLPAGATALDVGSGAGLLSAELARRGLQVTGTDSSPEMVELTRRRAGEVAVGDRLRVLPADAHRLPFGTGEFDLVMALGLLPWLHDAPGAVAELARVVKPGGWLIVTADNRVRLNCLVEPREHPLLLPLKLARRAVRRVPGRRSHGAASHRHLPAQVDRLIRTAGLFPLRRTTVGFGPFTFLGRSLLSDRAGVRLDVWLGRLAERRTPALRRLGWHYVVAARKPQLGIVGAG
jgi:ubiquinone/menaquinone biosynthesis C-methylase UbiE